MKKLLLTLFLICSAAAFAEKAVVIHPGLGVYDAPNNFKFKGNLTYGDVVTYDEVFTKKGSKIEYKNISYDNGELTGAASSWFIVGNAVPGAILQDTLFYKRDVLFDPSEIDVKALQFVAVIEEAGVSSDFSKIAYVYPQVKDGKTNWVKRVGYVKKNVVTLAHDDVQTAITVFLAKIEKSKEMKIKYLESIEDFYENNVFKDLVSEFLEDVKSDSVKTEEKESEGEELELDPNFAGNISYKPFERFTETLYLEPSLEGEVLEVEALGDMILLQRLKEPVEVKGEKKYWYKVTDSDNTFTAWTLGL